MQQTQSTCNAFVIKQANLPVLEVLVQLVDLIHHENLDAAPDSDSQNLGPNVKRRH